MSARFFLDRSLGDVHVPKGLREAGWSIVTMRERYGVLTAQTLADVDWISDAASQNEIMLTADKMIAKRPRERAAVLDSGARVIATRDGRLTAEAQIEQFLRFHSEIHAIADSPGPFVVSLSSKGLTRLGLRR